MPERESMTCGAVIVGGGPAGLSAALHLKNLIAAHNSLVEKGGGEGKKIEAEALGVDVLIALLEKGAAVGSHAISGAVMNPVALAELIPDYKEKGAPLEFEVARDEVYYLTASRAFRLPVVPPTMHNHGNHIISLNKLVKWLGAQLEAAEVDVFATFAGQELLYDGGRVVGVRTGDKGVNPDGTPKGNYEPGMDLKAKAVVLAEGSRGSLTKQHVKKLGLDAECNPQVYATGVKEVWEVPEGRVAGGRVIHTMGWPNDRATFGGGFVYDMQNNQLAVGFITGLDYRDPLLDPHLQFSRFKTHPHVRKLLEGGKMLYYGAKTLPEGGWFSIPKPYGDGFLIVGDSASLVNVPMLKGVHYAIKSGIIAAETLFDAFLNNDFSEAALSSYRVKLHSSYVGTELFASRNFRPLFKTGFHTGMIKSGLSIYSRGRYPWTKMKLHEDHTETLKLPAKYPRGVPKTGGVPKHDFKFDGALTFDKLTDVYNSGTTHEEKQPCHLQVPDLELCRTRCREEYGNPCEKFCPASVYEMVRDEQTGEMKDIKINFSNCVHCKTCDIKDPYENINWVCPEGGGGPQYVNL
ncbi:MAG: electron transfer flavoprotein-ubiquinone oxidoreductase [bacterium]